ncbi:MAG TPA: 3-dehydroquinate synthase [Patescibacteria group bacterium]|nr:3-dehydroquinate synthase [Patescibacteria group bacterium]
MEILHKVPVGLGKRSYTINIGRGLLNHAGELLPFDAKGRLMFVLADENVSEYANTVCASLKARGARACHVLTLPAGEKSKSMAELERVLAWMLDNGVDRQSVLIAIGGGVIGDLGGFASAIVLRGIPFIQIPTTLLAQVDSSVGGKTGINMPQGKNMVGSFHQPVAVITDLEVLETLPRRELLAGYAEIVKYGLINDPEFFIWLEKDGGKVTALDTAAIARAVATSCRKKAEIVAADETEQGQRALLNLGHTFGHALEAAAGYDGRLLHGEAVAIGMALAFQLSSRLGHCSQDDADRVKKHLSQTGLPVSIGMIQPKLAANDSELLNYMLHDKKAAGGRAVFILARGIGKSYIDKNVDMKDVQQVVLHSMKGAA